MGRLRLAGQTFAYPSLLVAPIADVAITDAESVLVTAQLDSLNAGDQIRAILQFTRGGTATGGTFRLRYGGLAGAILASVTGSIAGDPLILLCTSFRAIGAAGSAWGGGVIQNGALSGDNTGLLAAAVAVDTTAASSIVLTGVVAPAAATGTVRYATIERLRA